MTLMTKQTYDGSSIQKNKQKQHFEINICFYSESEFSGRAVPLQRQLKIGNLI